MQIFLSILLSLLLAWSCSYHAKRRGRNPNIWFAAGALFGLFALVWLFILPVKKTARAAAPAQPIASSLPPLLPIALEHNEKLWYFLDEEKKQFGPMSLNALGQAWQEGKVKQETYVWNEMMQDWERFRAVIKIEQNPA